MTGPSNSTYAKAPPVTVSLYDEAHPTLYISQLAYGFTKILDDRKDKTLDLVIPDDFPIENLERFLEESVDLIDPTLNNGNGMSFYNMNTIVERNEDALKQAFGGDNKKSLLYQKIVRSLREDFGSCIGDGEKMDGDNGLKRIFLTHNRYIQQKKACVYTVIKDTITKRIIVSFRGSAAPFFNRDWKTNFNILPASLRTPKKIKDNMKGKLHNDIIVHKGFHDYLFNNSFMDGQQRYDNIIADIRAAINGEAGYSVYVTGHSLGGALATMFSMKLAGCGEGHNDIPRPITCISWSAPASGSQGYRTAVEHLERGGYLRHLRINQWEDIVPAIVPSILPRPVKHVGIYLRLDKAGYRIEHTSRANFWTAWWNSWFKPIWRIMTWHLLPMHDERFEEHAEAFKGMKLDELYRDESIVSPDFIEGKIS